MAYENLSGGLGDLNPTDGVQAGEFLGWDDDTGDPIYGPLNISSIGDPYQPKTPLAPLLVLTQPQAVRDEVVLSWSINNEGRPTITSWVVQRRVSTNDGVSFGAYAAITGSPFTGSATGTTDSGLSTGTPEHIFQYRMWAVNGDGVGLFSNEPASQYQGTPAQPPTAPTNLTVSNITATSVRLNWVETPDPTVTKHQIWRFLTPGTVQVDNIDATATTYQWEGLTTGVTLTGINVRRVNSGGTSPASNTVSFTPVAPPSFSFNPVMACSNSDEDHGGTLAWTGWRVYDIDDAINIANRQGVQHPLILGVTDDGGGAGGIFTSYNDALTTWTSYLARFYETAGTATEIARRQDVEMHIANGNEYGDKVNSGNLAGFVNGCRGIYDATRLTTAGGARRFPLASSWLDPTHNQEQQTGVGNPSWETLDVSVHAAAPYLDGVAWSMYPPGRDTTAPDPTWDWPSFNEAHRYNLQRGYLIRCFMRTYEAQYPAEGGLEFPGGAAMAGNTYLTNFRPLKIACWEIGSGDDPDDQTTRPFWAAHCVASMGYLCYQFGLDMPFIAWWDQEKQDTAQDPGPHPENILSDEDAPTGTQISTRVAWQNWQQYDHFGIGHTPGSHPTAWSGNPKPTGSGAGQWKNRQQSWLTEWVNAMGSF